MTITKKFIFSKSNPEILPSEVSFNKDFFELKKLMVNDSQVIKRRLEVNINRLIYALGQEVCFISLPFSLKDGVLVLKSDNISFLVESCRYISKDKRIALFASFLPWVTPDNEQDPIAFFDFIYKLIEQILFITETRVVSGEGFIYIDINKGKCYLKIKPQSADEADYPYLILLD